MPKLVVHPDYAAHRTFFEQLPARFASEGKMLHDGRNRVKLLALSDGTPCVVKRYRVPHLLQRVVYRWFRPSKAERAYRFALRLPELSIDTPAPMAYLEERRGGLFGASYFVSAQCVHPSLYPVLVQAPEFSRPLAVQLAAFLVRMHEQGFLHGDLNLTNILYHTSPADGEIHFSVIDINRSHFIPRPTPEQCLHNLVRLTHRHELMEFVVREYARLRGWNADECWEQVQADLIRFERKEARKETLKRRIRK